MTSTPEIIHLQAKLNALSVLMELLLGKVFDWELDELVAFKASVLHRISFNSVAQQDSESALAIQTETIRIVDEVFSAVEQKVRSLK